jgi:hypothetical protein
MALYEPIPKSEPSINDVRSYFGVTGSGGSWSLGGSGGFYNSRELCGKKTGPISLNDLKGAAHGNWTGLDESAPPYHDPTTTARPLPGNWKRTKNGWPTENINGSSITSQQNGIQLYMDKVGVLDQPTSMGLNGFFEANANRVYNFIIQWRCLGQQGHDFAGYGKQTPSVFAGFAGYLSDYQQGEQFVYPNGNVSDTGVNFKKDVTTADSLVTWTGSFTAQLNRRFIVPYFNIWMDGISVGEGATLTVEVLQHRIWEA